MRRLLPVIAISLLVCTGCEVKYKPLAEYTCPEGNFKVLLPGEPRWTTKYATFLPIRIAEAFNPDMEFAVGYGEFITGPPKPADVPKTYAAMKNAVLAESKSTLLYEFACTVDGFPGQEFGCRLPGEKERISKMRSVIIGNKVYMYGVVGSRVTANSPEARQFFDSFKVINKPTPTPTMAMK
jgi:hypothetical protein